MVMAQPGHERSDVIGDHLLTANDFASAHFERLPDDTFERIDIVEKDAIEFVYGGVGVARDREVNHEEGPAGSLADHRRELFSVKYRVGGGCGADQDIHVGECILPMIEMDGETADLRS